MAYEGYQAVLEPHRLGTNDYSPQERAQVKVVQSRADQVFAEFGRKSPEPNHGESPFRYRTRLAEVLARETKLHRHGLDMSRVPSAEFFERKESAIYADALQQARHPLDLMPCEFREIKKTQAGKEYSEFVVGAHPDGSTTGAFRALYADCYAKPMGFGVAVNGVPESIPYVPA